MPEQMPMRTAARSVRIVDGSRSVHPNGRFPTAALALLGILALVPLLLAIVDERGLHGVRGSASIEASWDQIGTVDVVGLHGPKLAISVADQMPAIVDTHRIGSDPAAVAAVLIFFRDHPDHRQSLADGTTAMQTVTGALQP
ncbi:hypothetical protein [Microbacterium phyllosphaerae]